jgi:hypothetical protein
MRHDKEPLMVYNNKNIIGELMRKKEEKRKKEEDEEKKK